MIRVSLDHCSNQFTLSSLGYDACGWWQNTQLYWLGSFTLIITLLRSTGMFRGSNGIPWNIPHIKTECVNIHDYHVQYCRSHNTLLWILIMLLFFDVRSHPLINTPVIYVQLINLLSYLFRVNHIWLLFVVKWWFLIWWFSWHYIQKSQICNRILIMISMGFKRSHHKVWICQMYKIWILQQVALQQILAWPMISWPSILPILHSLLGNMGLEYTSRLTWVVKSNLWQLTFVNGVVS